jgi:hypothetical protein
VTSSVSLSLIAKDCSCYAANKHTMQPHHLNSRTCSVTSSVTHTSWKVPTYHNKYVLNQAKNHRAAPAA